MNIVILSGSPRKGGNTQQLVQAFTEGATAAGHKVAYFDTAALDIAPCASCYHCRREQTLGQCLLKDDMAQIYAAMSEADVLVFATPLYYYGFSAQLKTAIDRFFSIDGLKRTAESAGGITRLILLAVCGDGEEQARWSGLTENYRNICAYLGVENAGEILAAGAHGKGELTGHAALKAARDLAASL